MADCILRCESVPAQGKILCISLCLRYYQDFGQGYTLISIIARRANLRDLILRDACLYTYMSFVRCDRDDRGRY